MTDEARRTLGGRCGTWVLLENRGDWRAVSGQSGTLIEAGWHSTARQPARVCSRGIAAPVGWQRGVGQDGSSRMERSVLVW